MKRRKTVSALILLLAALLMLTGLSSCKDPEPKPLTDEEALRGQWAVYLVSPGTGDQAGTKTEAADQDTQETEIFSGIIIDIQYTKPGYWFVCSHIQETDPEKIKVFYDVGNNPESASGIDDKNVGFYISSDRTQEENGWFVVSANYWGDGTKIRYRFTDEDRDTMEAEMYEEKTESAPPAVNPDTEENTNTGNTEKCIMRRLNHVIEILPLSEAENPEEGEETSPT